MIIRSLYTAVFVVILFLQTVLAQQQQQQQQQHQHQQHHLQRGHIHQSGYHCSEEEVKFQFEYIDLVNGAICDSPTVWRLAHLAMPDISVFLDIGANRGYTAAKIFGLWSPGHDFSRKTLKKSILRDVQKKIVNDNNVDTVCGDGETEDLAMMCMGGLSPYPNNQCFHRRSIQVYSFDGQALHVQNTRNTIYNEWPELNPNASSSIIKGLRSSWEYNHYAMVGTNFENHTHGYFANATDESGRLIPWQEGNPIPDFSSVVPLMTVDKFVKERGLKTVDVIKVDAEGMDDEVLKGSFKTLHYNHVKMIEFECFDCGFERWQELFRTLDLNFGFDCYLSGNFHLLARITNCWNNSISYYPTRPLCETRATAGYFNCTEERDTASRLAGNGYCAHRFRAPLFAKLLDDMSLYKFANGRRGDIFDDALLSVGTEIKNGKRQGVEYYSAQALKRRSGRDQEKNFTKIWW